MSQPELPTPRRFIRPDGSNSLRRVGVRRWVWSDLYHFLMALSWPWLIGLVVGGFVTINLLFAFAFYFDPGGIENARPYSFADAFFFSVQTMATIGYGKMAPLSLWSNAMVSLEAFTSLIGISLTTGLMFAKFSLPTARLTFSNVMTVHQRDGRPSLVFRIANERGNHIVEAQVRLTMARADRTREGEQVRRVFDLQLVRSQNPLFVLSWLVIHPIDESSPIYGATPESLAQAGTEFVVSLVGIDGTMSQTVHARHAYNHADLRWNARFVDLFYNDEEGRTVIDYGRFHQTEPAVVTAEVDEIAARDEVGEMSERRGGRR